MNITKSLLTICVVALIGSVVGQDKETKKEAAPATKQTWVHVESYPLETCLVSGKPLEAEKMVAVEVNGRTFRTCCKNCPDKIKSDAAGFIKKLDEAIVSVGRANYPLTTCPVSGKTLGDTTQDLVLDNQLVRVCCKNCVTKAQEQKAEMVKTVLSAAFEKQKANYPLKTCAVMGDDLDPNNIVDVMYGSTLVRTCCEDCIDEIKKSPTKALTALAQAHAKAQAGKPSGSTPLPASSGKDGKGAEKAKEPAKGAAAASGDSCGACVDTGGCCGSEAKGGEKKTGCCESASAEKKTGCCESAGGEKQKTADPKTPAKPKVN